MSDLTAHDARARDRFAEIAAGPDAEIDLGEAALWIAAEAYPGLDVKAYLDRLDALAERARNELGTEGEDLERVDALNHFLYEEQGFEGNREDYEDPRNSYLNEVIDRKTGIPISLAVVYIEVARRLGWPVRGVGFPGHFLARYEGERAILIDPFFGQVITETECAERLRQAAGDAIELQPAMLDPTGSREILARMLRNLKHHYARRQEWEPTLAACDRILLLQPDSVDELRDRGLVYRELECYRPAVADLERFVELAPGHPMARAVRTELVELRQRASAIH